MRLPVSKIESSHYYELDHICSYGCSRLVRIIKRAVFTDHPHDKSKLGAVWNRNADTITVPSHVDSTRRVPGRGDVIHLSRTLVNVDSDVNTLAIVVHGPHTNLVNHIQPGSKGDILSID